jgi:hypothetical protein
VSCEMKKMLRELSATEAKNLEKWADHLPRA